jgi:hypothetical protein
VGAGFTEAYITAYMDGQRVPLFRARSITEEKGEGILIDE